MSSNENELGAKSPTLSRIAIRKVALAIGAVGTLVLVDPPEVQAAQLVPVAERVDHARESLRAEADGPGLDSEGRGPRGIAQWFNQWGNLWNNWGNWGNWRNWVNWGNLHQWLNGG